MEKVIFFVENGWAFGQLHKAVCKELYKHGIYANILDSSKSYTLEELDLLQKHYDIFVTLPNFAHILVNEYLIDPSKIIIMAHEQCDILYTIQMHGVEYFNKFKKYAVISDILKIKSKEWGISVEPIITECGVHFNHFYSPVKDNLKIVGYGGAKCSPNFYGVDRKRGYLVENCVKQIDGLILREHKFYNHLCMPGYYKEIDCLMMSSIQDAGGLPVVEAAAAGRLVISTPVGFFEHSGPLGGGIVVPLDEDGFMSESKKNLIYYMQNEKEYREKCHSIQSYARDNYDWSIRIKNWVNLFNC